MKRIFLYFLIMILFGTGAGWCVCEKGTIEFGHNGKCYCKSAHAWNFLHALAWCDAQASDGLSRSSINSVCDLDASHRWSPGDTNCPNFDNWKTLKQGNGNNLVKGYARVDTLRSNQYPYSVTLNNDGSVSVTATGGLNDIRYYYCDVQQSVCDEIRSSWNVE